MNSKLAVLASIPRYQFFRRFNFPYINPVNFTVLITTKCNSRCRTCNIWKQHRHDLDMEEWDQILKSIGTSPYWFTISGGEPFLPAHTAQLAESIYRYTKPGVINIPTNSLLVDKILSDVTQIATNCPHSQLVINLSLDGVGDIHDQIRGIKGNFVKFEQNYRNLRSLKKKFPRLVIGIHSVISKFNSHHIPQLVDYAYSLKPDQYICEIAEQRVELDTVGLDITPESDQFNQAIDYVIAKLKQEPISGFGHITRSFRLEYYQFVKNWRQGKPTNLTDYAGWASAQISSWGEVWPSCIGGINLGNLRHHQYNFNRVWQGKTAQKVRQILRHKEESFPLANAFYSNALHNPKILFKVASRMLV